MRQSPVGWRRGGASGATPSFALATTACSRSTGLPLLLLLPPLQALRLRLRLLLLLLLLLLLNQPCDPPLERCDAKRGRLFLIFPCDCRSCGRSGSSSSGRRRRKRTAVALRGG